MMRVTYEIVSDQDRLRVIGPAWRSLWQNARAGVFQSHPWISAWFAECPGDRGLRIGCAWDGDTLLAILPLYIRRWHGLRVLEWAAQPYSDYCDAIIDHSDPDLRVLLLETLWHTITSQGGYDLVRLKHIRDSAIVIGMLTRVGVRREREEVCLQIASQWSDGNSWFRNLNKKTRNNHTRGKRILSDKGEIVIRQLEEHEPRAPVVQRLLELKRLWPTNRGSPLVRNDTMLLSLVNALDRLNSLRIFLIEFDGTIIAGSINAIHEDRMLALFATYDPQYNNAGPGIILMTEYTMWALDRNITEIDYLLGAESYKFKFANRHIRLHIFVKARTLRGLIALAVYRRIRSNAPDDLDIGSAYRTEKGTPRAVPAEQPKKAALREPAKP